MLQTDWLGSSSVKKDLWVVVDSKLNMGQWYTMAARKASGILGYIYRSIDSRSREIIILLYSGLIRPHLEYHIQFVICQYKEAINKLE